MPYSRKEEPAEFLLAQKGPIQDCMPHQNDWAEIKDLVDLLKPLAMATTETSAFLKPTLQSAKNILNYVDRHLQNVPTDPHVVRILRCSSSGAAV